MFKNTILFCSAILVFNISNAQNSDSKFTYPHLKMGLKGGLNICSITDLDKTLGADLKNLFENSNSGNRVTVPLTQGLGLQGNGGFVANVALAKVFSFQLEGNYFQAGGDIAGVVSNQNTSSVITIDSKYRINYLQFPLLAKLSLGNKAARFELFAGPAYAMALNSNFTITASDGVNSSTTSTAVPIGKNGVSSYDIQGIVGFGLSANAGPGDIIFDFRYNRGFKDTNDSSTSSTSLVSNYNSVFGISVGYVFYMQ